MSIIILAGMFVLSALTGVSFALPEIEEVVSGQASLSYPDASTLKIDAADKTIINYKSFNIASLESVIVNLPQAGSEILNRVTRDTASSILGSLTCSGIFMLVNSNGINIGPSANIDAAGFLASTRDITNSNFLNARYVFEKSSQEQLDYLLLNQGNINIREGGFAALIAGAIENQGSIAAQLGTVVLVGADMVTLDISSDRLISVVIDQATTSKVFDQNGLAITDQIKNTGILQADGGMVLLKAESVTDIFRSAINLEGYVRADSFQKESGIVKLITKGRVTINGQVKATDIIIGSKDEAFPTLVNMVTGKLVADSSVSLAANSLFITSLTPLTQLYKNGDIRLSSSILKDGLITLAGEGISVTYLKDNNLSLRTDNRVATSATVVIPGNQVKVVARQFGSTAVPLSIQANQTYIQRLDADIDIRESIGLGSTVMLRGPPEDGFGAITYTRTSDLVLEANKIILSGSQEVNLYGNITFYNFSYEAVNKEIYFEAGHTYTFKGDTYIKGASGYNGLIKFFSSQAGINWYSDFSQADKVQISYLAIRDGYNIAKEVKARPATNWGNSFGWDTDPVWDGGGADNNWSTAANWDTDTIPTSSDTVTFDLTSIKDSIVDSPFGGTVATLNINLGYLGTITLARTLNVTSSYTQSAGTFTCGANDLTLNNFSMLGGTFNAPSTNLTITGSFTYLGGALTNNNTTVYFDGDITILSLFFPNIRAIIKIGLTQEQIEEAVRNTNTLFDLVMVVLENIEAGNITGSLGGISLSDIIALVKEFIQTQAFAAELEAGFSSAGLEGGARYEKLYLPGVYRTVVIVLEGLLAIADYNISGPIPESEKILSPGQSISVKGEVKP